METPTPDGLYLQFAGTISRLSRRMIRNPETARDAAQEAWYEILRSLGSFNGSSAVGTWVWTIARRSILRHAAREKTWTTRFLAELFSVRGDEGLTEMDQIPAEDRNAWIRLQCSDCLTGIMHCVPNEERLVYLLRTLGNLGYGEIASVTGRSESAVRQSWSRSTRKLRHFLDSQCTLYNSEGTCRCKMKEPIKALEQTADYLNIRKMAKKIWFLEAAESFFAPPATIAK
jgi:RNA polymerase sigma factor (sigma-70 family)